MPYSIRPYRRLPLTYFSGFWSLIMLLVLSSGAGYAEWKKINENETFTVYVDPDTVRRKGDLVKMWELYDFKTVQTVDGDSYLSSKHQTEFDCAEERSRIRAYTWFSGNKGGDKPVYSHSDEGKWEPVSPGSVGLILWKFACGKE